MRRRPRGTGERKKEYIKGGERQRKNRRDEEV